MDTQEGSFASVDKTGRRSAVSSALANITARQWTFLALVLVMYLSALAYVAKQGLSFRALFLYGLLQPTGVPEEEARLVEIATPLSWNLAKVAWFIYIKAAAVLVELFQYWVVGMLIAAALVTFVSWEKVKEKMGYGGFFANFMATGAGAVIPICSCGIVPVLAGMVEAGIPLGPTMAFLVAAPMLNVPTVFMTAGILGWPMALARVLATFVIALTVGQILTRWQARHRGMRKFLKIRVVPRLSPELQKFAFEFGLKAVAKPAGISPSELEPGAVEKLRLLEEAGLVAQDREGRWRLVEAEDVQLGDVGACAVLPTGDASPASLSQRLLETGRLAWKLFLQLNSYLLLAVLIAGGIKVLIPTSLITEWVGGKALDSVLVASAVALLAYVCTYVEVPTALALMHKGMGPGATLAYLLGGPGLSLPSIAMLSGVFRWPVLVLYVAVSFVGCVVAGYVFNLLV